MRELDFSDRTVAQRWHEIKPILRETIPRALPMRRGVGSSPPSGPRSMIQSAVLMSSRLCSIARTELPTSVKLSSLIEEHFALASMAPECAMLELLPLDRRVADEVVIDGKRQEDI